MTEEQLHRIEYLIEGEYSEQNMRELSAQWSDKDTSFLRAIRSKLAELDAEREAAKTVQDRAVDVLNGVYDDSPGVNAEIVNTLAGRGLLAPDEPPKMLIDRMKDMGIIYATVVAESEFFRALIEEGR